MTNNIGIKVPDRHVNVGFDGATPKQVHTYDFREPVQDSSQERGGQPTTTVTSLREAFQELSYKIKSIKEQTSNTLARPQTSYQKRRNVENNNSSSSNLAEEVEEEEEKVERGSRTRFSPTRDGRPKTSRGKPHPSPDEFFNYVVPSPANARDSRSAFLEVADREEVVLFDEGGAFEQGYRVVDSIARPAEESDEQQQQQHSEERRRIRLLGCWLFGSALRM